MFRYMFLYYMSALKHIVGCGGILITLDGYFLNGFCTKAFSQTLSLASNQLAPTLDEIGAFSLTQFIHSFI
jgi:hypothetical protein